MSALGVRFVPSDPSAPPASGLIEAMESEMLALYGVPGSGEVTAPSGGGGHEPAPADPLSGAGHRAAGSAHLGTALEPSELSPPRGVYLVGTVGDEVAAGGGLRTLAAGIGEIKRMYVVPRWRGRGLGAALLAELEVHAAGVLGLRVTRLDTGPRQPLAQRMYERAGYRSIGNYNANPHAGFWGEKQLGGCGYGTGPVG